MCTQPPQQSYTQSPHLGSIQKSLPDYLKNNLINVNINIHKWMHFTSHLLHKKRNTCSFCQVSLTKSRSLSERKVMIFTAERMTSSPRWKENTFQCSKHCILDPICHISHKPTSSPCCLRSSNSHKFYLTVTIHKAPSLFLHVFSVHGTYLSQSAYLTPCHSTRIHSPHTTSPYMIIIGRIPQQNTS